VATRQHPGGRAGLRALEAAIARGDLDATRQVLLELGSDERQILAAQMGPVAEHRLRRTAARSRRGRPRGRVLLLHGIMGSKLDGLDAGGDADRIWIHPWRILRGRLAELALDAGGGPARPEYRVRPAGHFGTVYLPLLLGLDREWDARPFAFDWRLDLDTSARALAAAIAAWTPHAPLHLVAHSMGGLVARRFAQLFPAEWAALRDPDGLQRGGRLVLLGTPNRGSFAIPLALSGEEAVVKWLARLDARHDRMQLLRILNSFAGSFSMLPSPLLDLDGDDHRALYRQASWGGLPVTQAHLDRAHALHELLDAGIDPDRLVYVAGFGHPTPHRIRIDAPGRFSYRITTDGDGRVPHELGLLNGVRTFWCADGHGDLARSEAVLQGIHDLLATGTTTALPSARPDDALRAVAARAAEWIAAGDVDALPAEVEALTARARARRGAAAASPLPEDAALRMQALALAGWLGAPGPAPAGAAAPEPDGGRRRRVAAASVPLQVEVVCDDIRQVTGDVYAVGHYRGVAPQNAELALDQVVSGPAGSAPPKLVLTDLTRRGVLRGDLGEVALYPWAGSRRLVAVCGMGHPGGFGEREQRLLARNLTLAVAALPEVRTVCTVLIGSGEGNLDLETAVGGLMAGVADALATGEVQSPIRRLRLVELHRDKAERILAALCTVQASGVLEPYVRLRLPRQVAMGRAGSASSEYVLEVTARAAIRAARAPAGSRRRGALAGLLADAPPPSTGGPRLGADLIEKRLRDLSRDGDDGPPLRVVVGAAALTGSATIPTRLSFVVDSGRVRVAAITATATVPERIHEFDQSLLYELQARMVDPAPENVAELSSFLAQLVVPSEFRTLLRRAPGAFVFEVDRDMAPVHWEMLAQDPELREAGAAVGLVAPVARQLRTPYSPPPLPDVQSSPPLRALVVGDPGDPDEGDALPGARQEARQVVRFLRARGVLVTALVGAPDARGRGPLPGVPPADRVEVLRLLLRGGFDLLHYCGHGDFDPQDGRRAGWVFKGGLLTSRELERVDLAPRLVVANACLSGLTSRVRPRDAAEAHLLPSLADEFFRRGVRDYVGTAWEVDDEGAVLFATTLYDRLLTPAEDADLGRALLAARLALHARRADFGSLWAAYQHYGDPSMRLVERA
jgi:hypothetical protein